MYEKKLSIIIPTRNRQIYANKCVRTILSINSDNFEVVVHDNSTDTSLRDMLQDVIDNPKLKYAYSSENLSFCSNFEKSVELSSGDYIIMIGDDDCVLPAIVDLANVMRDKGIESVLFPTENSYYWPNAIKDNQGKLVVRKDRLYVKKLSPETAISDMMAVGNYDYQKYSFPKIYHGIVKRENLDRVKEKTGHIFGGLTPDIYSAVALSFYTKRMVYVNYPFTQPGMCAKSGSADSVTGRHTGELKDAPHFRGHDNYEWDSQIPYLYSIDTIWAETAFKAIQENGGKVSLNKEQFFNFSIYIGGRSPQFWDRLADMYASKYGENKEKAYARLVKKIKAESRKKYIKRRWNFAVQLLKGRYTYNGINDIEKAVSIVVKKQNKHLKAIELVKKLDY